MQQRRVVEDDLITGYWDGSRDRTTGRVFGPEEELGKRIRVARVALDFGELGGALGRVESWRWAGPQLTPGFQDPGLPAAHAGQEWVARPEPRPRRNCAGPFLVRAVGARALDDSSSNRL